MTTNTTPEVCFTRQFLRKFPAIDELTIDALVDEDVTTRERLLMLDVEWFIPQIGIKLGQKGVLRKILLDLQSKETINLDTVQRSNEVLNELSLDAQSVATPPPTSPALLASPAVTSTRPSLTAPPIATASSSRSQTDPILSTPSTSRHQSVTSTANSLPNRRQNCFSNPSTSRPRKVFAKSTSGGPSGPPSRPRIKPRMGPRSVMERLNNQPIRQLVNKCDQLVDTRYILKSSPLGQLLARTRAAELKGETSKSFDNQIKKTDVVVVKQESSISSSRDPIPKTSTDEQINTDITNDTMNRSKSDANNNSTITKDLGNKSESNLDTETEIDEDIAGHESAADSVISSGRPKRLKKRTATVTSQANTSKAVKTYDCLFRNCSEKFANCEELRLHRLNHAETLKQIKLTMKPEPADVVAEPVVKPMSDNAGKVVAKSVAKPLADKLVDKSTDEQMSEEEAVDEPPVYERKMTRSLAKTTGDKVMDTTEEQVTDEPEVGRKITRSVSKHHLVTKDMPKINDINETQDTNNETNNTELISNTSIAVSDDHNLLPIESIRSSIKSEVLTDDYETMMSLDNISMSSASDVSDNSRWKCKCRYGDCMQVFDSKDRLRQHVKDKHFKKCDKCSKYFIYDCDLIDHQNSAHPPKDNIRSTDVPEVIRMTLRARSGGVWYCDNNKDSNNDDDNYNTCDKSGANSTQNGGDSDGQSLSSAIPSTPSKTTIKDGNETNEECNTNSNQNSNSHQTMQYFTDCDNSFDNQLTDPIGHKETHNQFITDLNDFYKTTQTDISMESALEGQSSDCNKRLFTDSPEKIINKKSKTFNEDTYRLRRQRRLENPINHLNGYLDGHTSITQTKESIDGLIPDRSLNKRPKKKIVRTSEIYNIGQRRQRSEESLKSLDIDLNVSDETDDQTVASTHGLRRDLTPKKPKKYVCEVNGCDKQFAFKLNLKTHQSSHLADKPHQCADCHTV